MTTTSHRSCVLLPTLVSTTLSLPACVLVTDFGETEDTDGATTTDTDGATSAAEPPPGDSSGTDTEPASPPAIPTLMWSMALEHEPEHESYYIGTARGTNGGIYTAGGWWNTATFQGGATIHHYTPDGVRSMEGDVPLPTAMNFSDACVTPQGTILAVSRHVAHPTDPSSAVFGLVELSATGDVLHVLNEVLSEDEQDEVNNTFPRLLCDPEGHAWFVLQTWNGSHLMRFGSDGVLFDEWLGPDPATLRHDAGTLYLAHHDEYNDQIRWQRRDLDGMLIDERLSDECIDAFEVRGPWIIKQFHEQAGSTVIMTDLVGNEQWQIDQIDGEALDVTAMGLDDQGQAVVTWYPPGSSSDAKLSLLGPDGGVLHTENLPRVAPPPDESYVGVLDLAVDSDGAITIAGIEGSWAPSHEGLSQRAWIARYEWL